jgi:peptidoglycan hydrolase-like protein with peptidoglycan-binding domain
LRSRKVQDEEEAPRMKRLPALALLATTAMAAAIVYNTVIDGPGRGGRKNTLEAEDAIAGGTTKMLVDGGDTTASVVTLRYDPTVEAVQKELLASGFYKGPVDGVFGKRTKKAIVDYETANSLPETGKATPRLIEHIKFTREVAQAAKFTGSTGAAALDEPEADPGAALEPDPTPEPDDTTAPVRKLQQSLAELGYAPGPVDGALSDATRRAIREFERDRGLAETGEASADVLMELAKISGGAEPAN